MPSHRSARGGARRSDEPGAAGQPKDHSRTLLRYEPDNLVIGALAVAGDLIGYDLFRQPQPGAIVPKDLLTFE